MLFCSMDAKMSAQSTHNWKLFITLYTDMVYLYYQFEDDGLDFPFLETVYCTYCRNWHNAIDMDSSHS